MCKFHLTRSCVPGILAGAILIACGQPQSQPDPTTAPAAANASARWEGVIEAPPLASAGSALAVGSRWEGVIEAPPLAEASATIVHTETSSGV